MEYENLQSIQKAGGSTVLNRERKRPKHVKGAEIESKNLSEKSKLLSESRSKLDKQTDKLHAYKLKGMQGEKRTQDQIKHFEALGVKVRAKIQDPEVIAEYKKDIKNVESHIQKQKSQIQQTISDISPIAAEKMVSKLKHLVASYDVNKEENLEILKGFSHKETITADDFKTLVNMHEEVLQSKTIQPELKEALAAGTPYGLTPEAMEFLTHEEYNLGYTYEHITKVEKELSDEPVATEKPRVKAYAIFHDTEKEAKVSEVDNITPISEASPKNDAQENVKTVEQEASDEIGIEAPMAAAVAAQPLQKEGLFSSFKRSLNESITKLQLKISQEYHKYTGEYLHKEADVLDEVTQKAEAPMVDDAHEIVLNETMHRPEEISMNTVLAGQHPKIHTISMEQDGVQMVCSLRMSDDLLKTDMSNVEKEAYLEQNPTSIEASNASFMEVAQGLDNRLHPQNFTKDEESITLLKESRERKEPTIGDDLPEIENERVALGNVDEIELEQEFHQTIALDLGSQSR